MAAAFLSNPIRNSLSFVSRSSGILSTALLITLIAIGSKKLVIIKEAQELDIFKRNNDIKNKLLINYLSNLNPSTTLIFCLNNKTLDKRGKLFKSFNESSSILDSSSKDNKIYDNQLPKWIESEVMKKKYSISNDALLILTENIGNNLEKIDNALNKIYSNIESRNISKDDILNLIGINREYNLFEFQDSLIDRNSLKFGKIMNYFTSNEKKVSNTTTYNIYVWFLL